MQTAHSSAGTEKNCLRAAIHVFGFSTGLNKYVMVSILVMIGITISFSNIPTMAVDGQLSTSFSANKIIPLNSTSYKSNTNGDNLDLTWIKVNETKADNSPVVGISISSQEFWKFFAPLLDH